MYTIPFYLSHSSGFHPKKRLVSAAPIEKTRKKNKRQKWVWLIPAFLNRTITICLHIHRIRNIFKHKSFDKTYLRDITHYVELMGTIIHLILSSGILQFPVYYTKNRYETGALFTDSRKAMTEALGRLNAWDWKFAMLTKHTELTSTCNWFAMRMRKLLERQNFLPGF